MAYQISSRTTRIVLAAIMMTAMFVATGSAQGRRNNGRGITVFTNPNYSGESTFFRDDQPDLRNYGLNDKISSIEITDGSAWEICQDINFGNRCQVLTGSISDLRSMGWNDRISSLRRVGNGGNWNRNNNTNNNTYYGNGNRTQELVLFDRMNFRGNSSVFNGDSTNFGGRLLASAEVRGGIWEFCDSTGRCARVSQDVPNIAQLGLNGRITSIRRINGNDNYGQYRRYGRDQYYRP
jgi:hypothetical protein